MHRWWVDNVVMNIGMIGFTPGNGHPFSFSAIINGYVDELMRRAGWGVIADYLPETERPLLDSTDARVSVVWGDESESADELMKACKIPRMVSDPSEMLGDVDAVIIARGDWENHAFFALPFLDAGIPVFVDKPLTLDAADLDRLAPYLYSGRLATWSGLRFAPELDGFSQHVRLATRLRALSIRNWDDYAIHVVEPVLRVKGAVPVSVSALREAGDDVVMRFQDGVRCEVHIDTNENASKFFLEATSEGTHHAVELADRLTAFTRSMEAFVKQVTTGTPSVDPDETVGVIRTLIMGKRALAVRNLEGGG